MYPRDHQLLEDLKRAFGTYPFSLQLGRWWGDNGGTLARLNGDEESLERLVSAGMVRKLDDGARYSVV